TIIVTMKHVAGGNGSLPDLHMSKMAIDRGLLKVSLWGAKARCEGVEFIFGCPTRVGDVTRQTVHASNVS
ncbi:hypothetical protein, partial [Mesorhizobium sp.]|uniref:hypothetical protein n=1 Tax=Mesorhizobium sp. TaxID=1871066 RepID=UPI0025BE3290